MTTSRKMQQDMGGRVEGTTVMKLVTVKYSPVSFPQLHKLKSLTIMSTFLQKMNRKCSFIFAAVHKQREASGIRE